MIDQKPAFAKMLIAVLIMAAFLIYLQSCKKEGDPLEPIAAEEAIKASMRYTMGQMQAPGCLVSIKTPESIYEYAGGKADLSSDTDMSTTNLIRIGSITKTFTATLTLILCDEGILRLNDKLYEYYPEFPGADKIEIRHLLQHTSGIVTWDENEEIRMQIYNGTGDWNIDKLIDWASEQSLHSEPGEEMHYSNIGYFLLGKILEQSSGSTVAELIRQKICIPLGFTQTFMPAIPYPSGDVIHGYDESSGEVLDMTATPQAEAINFELAWTAGGMLSNLDELSSWSRALVNGTLLSDSLHQQQMPVLNPPTQSVPYWTGYGMGISQADAWIGHTGAICGFICHMQYYPGKDVSIITFFNKFSAFDINANAEDMANAGANFMTLAKYMCPETL